MNAVSPISTAASATPPPTKACSTPPTTSSTRPSARCSWPRASAVVCRISYDAEPERELDRLARDFGVRVLRSAKPIDPARRELDEYFEGSGRSSTYRSTSLCSPTSTVASCASSPVSLTARSSPTASSQRAPLGRVPLAPLGW